MINFIDRNRPAEVKAYTSQASRLKGKEKASGDNFTLDSSQDRVLLSPMAKEIQMAKNWLQTIPDVRVEKVAEIKNQIALGAYQISSERIAHRMMGESLMNELL
ncbi:MAG: flagellar biosynthesis anti-sigma factor FlgM [Deltaproteobacteria bacterium]